MINKNNFYLNTLQFKKNLSKTKKIFNYFKKSLSNFELPLFQSFEKKYIFDFNLKTINKFLKYKNIIIIGTGGSILGTKSIYSFFKSKIKKKIFFFDNLDLNLNLEFNKLKNLKNSCFIVISKSGNTLETLTNLKNIITKTEVKNRLVIITELKNNSLIQIAEKFDAEIIEHKDFIPGRYSVLSEVGMFPAALMNLDINKFRNLDSLLDNSYFVTCLIKSVASIYTFNQKGIRNSIILNYDSRLNDLCLWYQQLIGESLGKEGKGINPSISICPKDHHSVLQLYLDGPKDKFFTFYSSIQKRNINRSYSKIQKTINAQLEATKNIFNKKKIPFRHFVFDKNDESELGWFITFSVLETILLANLMGVNPFDQPAVEQIKNETKKILLR